MPRSGTLSIVALACLLFSAPSPAPLPEAARTTAEATFLANVGETYDFEFTPTLPGDYFLEIIRGTGVVNASSGA